MKYSITHKELKEISQLAHKYRDDQVFAGLNKFNLKQIRLLSIEVGQQNLRLTKYYIELEELADYYTNHYAVDDGQYFAIDKILFREIRKSFFFLIRTRFRFRPRSPYGRFNYLGEHVVYSNSTYSVLCGSTGVQLDLFGRRSFPELVQILCRNFSEFFSTLKKCTELCQQVLDTEESIRKNPMLCKMLYQQDYQEMLQQCRLVVKAYDELLKSDMVDVLGSDTDEAIQNGFHKLTRKQMLAHVLHNEIRKTKQIDLDNDESGLFAHRTADYVRGVRYVLNNLDKMALKGRGNTMSSATIVCLLDKLQIEQGKEKAFYDYLIKKYSGCYEIPSYQAVNKAKNKMLRIENDSEQRDLSEKFDRLWESYTASSKEKSSRLPIVPNNVYALS